MTTPVVRAKASRAEAATSGNGLYGWAEWYSVGLVMACSTTATVLTITGSNECFFHGLGE